MEVIQRNARSEMPEDQVETLRMSSHEGQAIVKADRVCVRHYYQPERESGSLKIKSCWPSSPAIHVAGHAITRYSHHS